MSVRLSWNLRWRLSILWFLEWGITGAVMTYLPVYWDSISLPKTQQAQLYAVTAVGLWLAPFIVGQLADRWVATERLLAALHFIGGLSLYALAMGMDLYEETAANFQSLLWMVGTFSVAYFPTVPLVSALCFRHLPDPDGQFGKVRVWGTVGWMIAGLSLSFWLDREQVFAWLAENRPAWTWASGLKDAIRWMPRPASSDCFRMSALLSFALSSFCVFLPHTPPVKKVEQRIAPVAILGMFKDKTFALFMGISFLLAVLVVPLYNMAVPRQLEEFGVQGNWVPTVMLVGQISEFPSLLLLAMCLRRMGLKTTFACGIAAWALRYAFFSIGGPWWLVLTGLALHGVCHVFLIIVAQLYIDSQCRKDLRASAQNLLSFITLGIGMPVGALLAGQLRVQFQNSSALLFAAPAVAAIALLCVFWKLVHFPDLRGTSIAPEAPVHT